MRIQRSNLVKCLAAILAIGAKQVRWGLVLLLLAGWPRASAHMVHPRFDCLTLQDGLSQSTVSSIVQDDLGYMWFGTIDGLNRYDGYDVTVYENIPEDTTSIADDWITALCLDDEGILWIGTLSRGLCKYNQRTDQFTNFALNVVEVDSPLRQRLLAELPFTFSYLNYYTIKSVFEDSRGILWLGTFGGGLYQFDRKNQSFIHVPFVDDPTGGLASNIMSITESGTGSERVLWIGTYGGGLVRYTEADGFAYFRHDPDNRNSLGDDRIVTIYPDTLGRSSVLWIGTFGGGLDRLAIGENRFLHYRYDPRNAASLSSNFILSILRDGCGSLWVGTFDAGLNRLEFKANKFHRFQHDPLNSSSIGSNEVLSLYEDRSGNVWIGTNFGNGLNKFNRRKSAFSHCYHDPSNTNSLSEQVVFSIREDREGILWIGTFQTGLNRYDRRANQFTNYRRDPHHPHSLSDNHIRAIFEDSRGRLWIGTFSGGLNYFHREKNRFIQFKHDPLDSTTISGNQVRAICEDAMGRLWIAVFGGGLDMLDPETGEFKHFQHEPDNPNSLSNNNVYYVCAQPAGEIWAATFGGGISVYHWASGKFETLRHDPTSVNSLADDRVLTIHIDQDQEDIVWIGTFGSGLDKYHKTDHWFAHYSHADGLPNDVVYSILPDCNGNLWLSTNKGLSKFNPEAENFINYDVADGLQSNEFNAGAYHLNRRSGEMFFGGVNGFTSFFPDQIEVNDVAPPVVITSFKIFDEEITDRIGPIFTGKRIELTHEANFFAFEFSVLDFTDVNKNCFAYKLDGLDKDWIHSGTRRYVNYTNLDPGEYVFRVKGANSDGTWNNQGTSVELKIRPRFYQNWWFHPMVVSVLIMGVIGFYTNRMRMKIKRSIELERVRNEETERVRKTIAADFHDELGQKLTKISLFSEIIKRKLVGIASENFEYIEKINNAAKELSHSTRDFIWSVNPSQDSLYDVAIHLKDFGDELFDKTGINFRVQGITRELEQVKLNMEWRRHLVLIFKEAMNNVLKHAECSDVRFAIQLQGQHLEIRLSDDGRGCNVHENTNGLGLHNMQNRARLIHSEVTITSNNGEGTHIKFMGEIP